MFLIRCLYVLVVLISLSNECFAVDDDDIQDIIKTEIFDTENKSTEGKWLPVPIPVSNPTIGNGLQLALLYLHPTNENAKDVPNSTTGLGVMWTDTDSKAVAIFHENYFSKDKYRLKVMAGEVDLNLDYYGQGSNSQTSSVQYNFKTKTTYLQLLSRIGNTENWFAGMRHFWLDTNLKFEISNQFPNLPSLTKNNVTSSLGLVLMYDTRDNNYYPTNGIEAEVSWMKDSDKWGSNFTFENHNAFIKSFWTIAEQQVLAVKTSLSDVSGDAPFYLLSNLNIRGYASGRYLDNTSIEAQVEWRYKFLPNWGVITFADFGRIGNSFNELSDQPSISGYGFGIRWQAIEGKPLHIGLDFAYNDDGEHSIYIRVGESF